MASAFVTPAPPMGQAPGLSPRIFLEASATTTSASTAAAAGHCALLGRFGIVVQGLLFGVCCCVLVYKKLREDHVLHLSGAPARSWRDFCLDSSKQLMGAGFVHVLNMGLSSVMSGFEGDACDWYWINIMVDTTVGVFIEYVLLTLLTPIAENCTGETGDFESGHYLDHSHKCVPKKFIRQVGLWLGCIAGMKIIVLIFLLQVQTTALEIASTILFAVSWSPQLHLIVVMLVTPAVMNSVQFWLTDNFLRKGGCSCMGSLKGFFSASHKKDPKPRTLSSHSEPHHHPHHQHMEPLLSADPDLGNSDFSDGSVALTPTIPKLNLPHNGGGHGHYSGVSPRSGSVSVGSAQFKHTTLLPSFIDSEMLRFKDEIARLEQELQKSQDDTRQESLRHQQELKEQAARLSQDIKRVQEEERKARDQARSERDRVGQANQALHERAEQEAEDHQKQVKRLEEARAKAERDLRAEVDRLATLQSSAEREAEDHLKQVRRLQEEMAKAAEQAPPRTPPREGGPSTAPAGSRTGAAVLALQESHARGAEQDRRLDELEEKLHHGRTAASPSGSHPQLTNGSHHLLSSASSRERYVAGDCSMDLAVEATWDEFMALNLKA